MPKTQTSKQTNRDKLTEIHKLTRSKKQIANEQILQTLSNPRGTFPPTIQLSDLNGQTGFSVPGVQTGDNFGAVRNVFDMNGDRIDIFGIGAPQASPPDSKSPGGTRVQAGITYVVFSRKDLGNQGSFNVSTLDGATGFAVYGAAAYDWSGYTVTGIRDVNGDKRNDLLITAPGCFAPDACRTKTGQAYVLFGSETYPSVIDLANFPKERGFVINGENPGDALGTSASELGDINLRGKRNFIIGAHYASVPGRPYAGKSYVFFGGPDIGKTGVLNSADLDGNIGFAAYGWLANSFSGLSVTDGGNLNGNCSATAIIGSPYFSPYGVQNAGGTFGIWCKNTFPKSIDLANLMSAPDVGFVIFGI